jgi:uncharacterized protein (TIGR03435 family)
MSSILNTRQAAKSFGLRIGCLVALIAGYGLGQQVGTFSAVSIRSNRSGSESSETKTSPGRVSFVNVTPLSLIMRAFGAQETQVIGTPSWASQERFDVLAVTDGPELLGDVDRRPFLQALLIDRFELAFHKETRQISVWVLKVDKRGLKIHKHEGAGVYSMKVRNAEGKQILESTKGNLTRLVEILSRNTGKIVIDETKLQDDYDFKLEWVQDLDPGSSGPGLNTALREQLGLTLGNAKRPIEVTVVDRIARPSAN